MRARSAVLAAVVTGLLLSACSGDNEDPIVAGQSPAPTSTAASPTPSATTGGSSSGAVDPASVQANELAMVPVMMYHQVKSEICGACVYDQTPAEFKAELKRMAEADFYPVTTAQLIAGDIDIPAGKHPVVRTFDDSSASPIQLGADGKPAADSAVGIMEAYEAENPDFPAIGSFYVNGSPFNDPKALPWLIENGYEVGVHTVNHANLKQSSDATVQKEIANNVADIKALAPDAVVETMALPFGIAPLNKALLREGSSEGNSYTLKAALLVGSNPAKSPFNTDFDPFAIARIRSGPKTKPVETDSTYWLDQLEKGGWTPYTSDGDPEKISFPSTSKVTIDPEWADKANKYETAGGTGSSGSASPSASSSAGSTGATTAPSATPSTEPTP